MQVGWDDRGKGTLTVRQSKAEEDQTAESANIVFTMESGKVIVNGAVYKTLKIQKARCSSSLSRCWQQYALANNAPAGELPHGKAAFTGIGPCLSHDIQLCRCMFPDSCTSVSMVAEQP